MTVRINRYEACLRNKPPGNKKDAVYEAFGLLCAPDRCRSGPGLLASPFHLLYNPVNNGYLLRNIMSAGKIIEIGVLEAIALLMFVFAYMIGVKRKMELIAGYSEKTADRVHNKPGLARFIARVCVSVGIATAVMPLATYVWGTSATGMAMCIGGYGGFIVGTIVITMLQAREYTSPKYSAETQD